MSAPEINQPETVEVDSLKTSCDGGGGAMGHPTVYLTITPAKENFVDCPYCGKRFVLKEGADISDHH